MTPTIAMVNKIDLWKYDVKYSTLIQNQCDMQVNLSNILSPTEMCPTQKAALHIAGHWFYSCNYDVCLRPDAPFT